MHRRMTGIGCWLVLVLVEVLAAAPEATPAKPLSLQEVIQTALQNRADVNVALQTETSARAGRVSSRALLLPQANSTLNMVRGRSDGRQSGTNFAFTGDLNSEQGTFNFTWQFDGGGNLWRYRSAGYNIQGARAGVANAANTVRRNAATAYIESLRAQRLHGQALSNQRVVEAQLEMIRARIKVGDAAPVDEYPLNAQLANAKVQVISANNTVRTSASALREAMGLDYGPPLVVEDLPDPRGPEFAPLTRYLDAALSGRPDLIQSNASILSNLHSYRAAKTLVYPRLTLNYGNQQGYGNFSSLSRQWSISAFVSIPLWNWNGPAATARQSLTLVKSSAYQAEQLRKDISAQVEQSYLSLTNANERIGASKVEVEAAQKNLDAQNTRYRLGAGVTVVDVIEAQRQLNQAQTNLIQAIYDSYAEQANLEFAVGQGVELHNYARPFDLSRVAMRGSKSPPVESQPNTKKEKS